MEGSRQPDCLQDPSHKIPPPDMPAPANSWLVSETTSPIDYSPIIEATTSTVGGAGGAAMQLSIHCRKGRTEITVAGPTLLRSPNAYTLTYRLNADPPVQLAAATPSFGSGVSVGGDAIQLLKALPDGGDIVVRLSPRTGAVHEGHFRLDGLKNVREKLATACKWPHSGARPGG
ncbi:hypothetical protein IVB24_12035 [Bradyrhizobium sp. 192]|nr:hypothetical protein IVB24_12035 [Bradyrhizobium sp. 192]